MNADLTDNDSPHIFGSSSEVSFPGQSICPSQTHVLGMHMLLLHWNSCHVHARSGGDTHSQWTTLDTEVRRQSERQCKAVFALRHSDKPPSSDDSLGIGRRGKFSKTQNNLATYCSPFRRMRRDNLPLRHIASSSQCRNDWWRTSTESLRAAEIQNRIDLLKGNKQRLLQTPFSRSAHTQLFGIRMGILIFKDF